MLYGRDLSVKNVVALAVFAVVHNIDTASCSRWLLESSRNQKAGLQCSSVSLNHARCYCTDFALKWHLLRMQGPAASLFAA
jgi:hypothetical protein